MRLPLESSVSSLQTARRSGAQLDVLYKAKASLVKTVIPDGPLRFHVQNQARKQVVRYMGHPYILEHIDIWSPSRHAIGPGQYPGEIQLTHRRWDAAAGGSALPAGLVLCVMLADKGGIPPAMPERSGTESAVLPFLLAAGSDAEDVVRGADLPGLVGPSRGGDMYHYDSRQEGAHTSWIVFKNPHELSGEEVDLLARHPSPPALRTHTCGAAAGIQVALRSSDFTLIDVYSS